MYKNILILLPLVLAAIQVQAKSVTTKSYQQKPLEYIANDATKNEYSRSFFNRNQWGLSEKEWERYEKLMKGVRGSISPASISPIEVLGTHARNENERMRYAKIWAKIMYEDTDRILAFQRSYNKAFDQLYGHIPIIDDEKLNLAQNQTNNIQINDRILLFIKLEACDTCNAAARELLLITESKDVQFDIYFLDANNKSNDVKIREWARKNVYDKSRLKAGKITLNHDNGKLFRLTKNPISPVPMMFKTNDKETTQIFI